MFDSNIIKVVFCIQESRTFDEKQYHQVHPLYLSFKAGNGIGMKIVGGKTVKGTTESGAFVTAIFPGGVADQLHGELKEGNHFTYLDMYHFKL